MDRICINIAVHYAPDDYDYDYDYDAVCFRHIISTCIMKLIAIKYIIRKGHCARKVFVR